MFIADIKRVVEQVSRDKGIDVEILIRALEEALRSAARKKFGSKVDIEAQYSLIRVKSKSSSSKRLSMMR